MEFEFLMADGSHLTFFILLEDLNSCITKTDAENFLGSCHDKMRVRNQTKIYLVRNVVKVDN